MLIGYARVSTPDQSLDSQIDALKEAGCEEIFTDICSGAKDERPGLAKSLNYLRAGDTLVVVRLDRLGRSLSHLISTLDGLAAKKIEFKSLQESLDSSTLNGRLIFHIFAAIAEFERGLIKERVRAGMEAARARGRGGGRRRVLSDKQIEAGKILATNPNATVESICSILKCSRTTYYNYIYDSKKKA